MNKTVFYRGFVMFLCVFGVYVYGSIEVSLCGSGNCLESAGFHFIFGGASIFSSIVMLIGALLDDNLEENKDDKQ